MKILWIVILALGVIMSAMPHVSAGEARIATFAGGCFWCMQPPFDRQKGVVSTVVGYTGGEAPHPTYEDVSTGETGHLEAVEVMYDADKVTYRELLRIFWQSVDPTDPDGQFADVGEQYQTAIFYHDEDQRREAEASKAELSASRRFHKPITTRILPATPFYRAEEHHQKYYEKNVLHYQSYKKGSGREDFLKKTWGK